MKLDFKGLGAQPKKVAFLGVLVVLLAYFFYSNVLAPSDDTPQGRSRTATAATPSAAPAGNFGLPERKLRPSARRGSQTARPEFKMGSREKEPDPTAIDPTLRLDLLAKVQSVTVEGGERNLFQFGAAPLPKRPEPKIQPVLAAPGVGPDGAPVGNAALSATSAPPPPPIPLKFYGYSNRGQQGEKRAFFLDGDEIVVAVEGQMIKGRYKVIRIGINSVVVEDVQFQNQQTLALEEQSQLG
jgi:hypothetical protein